MKPLPLVLIAEKLFKISEGGFLFETKKIKSPSFTFFC